MADPYSAGKQLGEAIFGSQDKTYRDELGDVARSESAIEVARRNRAQALNEIAQQENRGKITPDLLGRALGGDIAAQAELGAATLQSNQTINLGQLGEFQRPHYGEAQNTRFDALGLGEAPADIGLANRATAFTEGRDYQPVRTLGGAFIQDAATIDSLNAVPTPSTLAQIEATERRTQAAVDRANRPPAPRATKPDRPTKPPTTAQAEATVLADARNAIAAGAPKAAVVKRLKDNGYSKLADRL